MKYLFLIVFFCYSTFFHVVPISMASVSPVFLSEVQIAGEKADDEFIELYNPSPDVIDLGGMQLRRRTQSGTESSIKVFEKNSLIPPNGFFLWGNSKGVFALPVADAQTSSSALSENNSVALFSSSGSQGILIDSLAWGTGSPFEPTAPVLSNPAKNTSLVRDRGTSLWSLSLSPSPTGSHAKPETPPEPDLLPAEPPLPAALHVRFNEILPNPKGDEKDGEFIELYNPDEFPVLLDNFVVKDASQTGHYIFPKQSRVPAKSFLVIRRQVFTFVLNNSDETLSLLDAGGKEIDHVSYASSKEDVSLNYIDGTWHGSRFPTPGLSNILNSLPKTTEKVPKKGYMGVPVSFDAHGKDADGDKLKYTWNFGDGHKSYKEATTHTYEGKGTYSVTLDTNDGSEDTVETFSLEIGAYPKVKVRITSLVPNPEGKDGENEWIMLVNRDKKSVNLRGYSVATGWKKLINHPIREDFILQSHGERKLTRIFSLFTLPNIKGKIELRAPNGDVLQKVKYKLEKSAGENIAFHKEKGKRWQWQNPITVKVTEVETETPETSEKKIEENVNEIDPDADEVIEESKPETTPHLKTFPVLLDYGTNLHLPNDIVLSSDDTEFIKEQKTENPAPSSFLDALNSALNEWQNEQ